MAFGLDSVSGIAGIISLSVTLFQGCIRGIQIVSAARHIGNDADRISCMLDWEEYRLLRWGEKVGLSGGLAPNRRLNWNIIHTLLTQLHDLLTDAKKLRERYKLQPLDEEADDIKSLSSATTAVSVSSSGSSSKLSRSLWSHATPSIRSSRAQMIHTSTSPLKKLRWAVLDQEKIRELIGNIAYFSNCLYGLLDYAENEFVRVGLSALLRDLVSRSSDSADVDLLKALLDKEAISDTESIAAAAELKQTRLLLGYDKRKDEVLSKTQNISGSNLNGSPAQAKPKLSKLKYAALDRKDPLAAHNGREVAKYKISNAKKNVNAWVLIEWKQADKRIDQIMEKRVQRLSCLMCMLTDQSFHALRFFGYLKHESVDPTAKHVNYAYVFELVDLTNDTNPDIKPEIRSLSDLIRQPRKPSLTERIRIALELAETILQLHTAGWLHKAICADNVLFTDRGTCSWERKSSLGPYVGGYEFTRNTFEETENMPPNPLMDLYRHPDSHNSSTGSGTTFRKIFDLYAFGCVLLELVLWQNLEDILFAAGSSNETSQDTSNLNKDQEAHVRRKIVLKGKDCLSDREQLKSFLDRVAYHGGDKICEVVTLCFLPPLKQHNESEPIDEEDIEDMLETSVQTQTNIVDLLRSLMPV